MTNRPERLSVGVRPYRADDLEACMDVFDSNVPEFFRSEERKDFRTFLGKLPGPYLVLTDAAGRVVACGGYASGEGGVVDLCWGMVRRSRHGSGLGRVLTEARLGHAVADPRVERVALSTSQLTTGFYERFGFRVVEVVHDGYGPGLDRCEMRLEISRDA